MGTVIVAFIFAILGAGGAIFAILRGVDIATKKYPKKQTLPDGRYKMTKVSDDTYDLELLEEEKGEGK